MDPMELLPPALRALSASPAQPVLPYEEALAVIEIFEQSRCAVARWEPDDGSAGAGGQVRRHAGEAWADYVSRCAQRVRRELHADATHVPGAVPRQYRLTVLAPPGPAGSR